MEKHVILCVLRNSMQEEMEELERAISMLELDREK